jgi:hypothetical protein
VTKLLAGRERGQVLLLPVAFAFEDVEPLGASADEVGVAAGIGDVRARPCAICDEEPSE